jgi:hypothetical protein
MRDERRKHVADTKAKASAVDFLTLLACKPEEYVIDGVAVELRALTFSEVQGIATKHSGDNTEMAFQALRLGLVTPQLDDAQWEQVRGGKSGPLMKMATRVMEISGMTEGSGPLAGNGS